MYSSASVTQVSQVTLLGILRFSTGLRSAMLSWGLFRPCQNKTQRQTLRCELSPAHSSLQSSSQWKGEAAGRCVRAICCVVSIGGSNITAVQAENFPNRPVLCVVSVVVLVWCWTLTARTEVDLPYTCPTPVLHLYCLPCGVKRSWLWYSRWKAAVTRLNVPFNEPAARWAVKLAS